MFSRMLVARSLCTLRFPGVLAKGVLMLEVLSTLLTIPAHPQPVSSLYMLLHVETVCGGVVTELAMVLVTPLADVFVHQVCTTALQLTCV